MTKAFWGGLAFTAFAAYLMKHAVDSFRLYGASLRWPSVPGRVLESRLTLSPHGQNLRNFWVKYEFEVEGKKYTDYRVALYTIVRKDEAERLARRFPDDATVEVFYRPGKPKTAVLVPGPPQSKKYSDLILATWGYCSESA